MARIVTVATSLIAIPLGPWFDHGGHGWAREYRNAIYPSCTPSPRTPLSWGRVGTANSIMLFFLYLGGLSPLVLGYLIGVGGGYSSATGYNYGLYFLVGISLSAGVLIALFTRETVGRFKAYDWALVSPERCGGVGAGPRQG